jgi:hypothetical protein
MYDSKTEKHIDVVIVNRETPVILLLLHIGTVFSQLQPSIRIVGWWRWKFSTEEGKTSIVHYL